MPERRTTRRRGAGGARDENEDEVLEQQQQQEQQEQVDQELVTGNDDDSETSAPSLPSLEGSQDSHGNEVTPTPTQFTADESMANRLMGEDSGEDLLDEEVGHPVGGFRDYRRIEQLDRYDSEGIDSQFEESALPEDQMRARLAAEEALQRRDQRRRRGRRLPGALDEDEDDDLRPRRRARREAFGLRADGEMSEDYEEEIPVRLEDVRGPLADAIAQEPVHRELKRRFTAFLRHFKARGADGENAAGAAADDSSLPVYVSKIADMCKANRQSLEVSYTDLSTAAPAIAIWLSDCPVAMLNLMHQVAKEVTLQLFPEYSEVREEVFVRIVDFPLVDAIRDIRQSHLHQLVRTTGVVTRRTGVFPQLQEVCFTCEKCGFVMGPFHQSTNEEVKPGSCPNCQSKGPFSLNVEGTVYRNYQKITLQESPGKVPAGRLPRTKEIILLHDLIDCARPGEEIDVTGVYEYSFDAGLHAKQGFPVFATLLEANSVTKKGDAFAAFALSDEDRTQINTLSRDPRIGKRIIKSIAPSIYGHTNIKTGIALALFGGQEKHVKGGGKHRVRGDINMLLLGDPGMAKSQFLKYIEQTSERSVYTTGKGASAVGLTAAVHRDPVTREWTLEGGALVLADRGTCLIDEFDKMNDQDRVSIHEAMEQQSISISKAGIVTSLQARCSVIAAANPVGGRYDAGKSFSENVELSDPILSRFDILCVVRDIVDPESDSRLASFVVDSHDKNHPDNVHDAEEEAEEKVVDEDLIDQSLLCKYISYAKQHCKPRLQSGDLDKLARVYAELRRESLATPGGIPIAVRHLESLIRMSEAHARMHLRTTVIDEDIDVAIKVLLEGFITSQRLSAQKQLRRRLRRFIARGTEDYKDLLMHVLKSLMRDQVRLEAARAVSRQGVTEGEMPSIQVDLRYFEDKAKEYGITDLKPFYESESFRRGYGLDEASGTITNIGE
ncbi:minichromosome maintenance protein [Chloropicon primus]|nr:minichromosome maintenance protein [Chloropicon primus]